MAERAAHLVDRVLPAVPMRQWVLSLPFGLRYVLAWDHALCRAVLAVYVRALRGYYCRRARRAGIRDAETGAITAIQRFGSGLNLNVHFHTLHLDGVFCREGSQWRFVPAPPPSARELARLVATIARRIERLLARRGVALTASEADTRDLLAEDAPALAALAAASVAGRSVLGRAPHAHVARIGSDPDGATPKPETPWHARHASFDLHAGRTVRADDRAGLERLCHYLLRPPLAQERLELLPDGRVGLTLARPWADGTCALVFTGVELLEKLAVLIPKPRINLLVYHGILAPRARHRAAALGTTTTVSSTPPSATPTAALSQPAATATATPGCASAAPAKLVRAPVSAEGAPGSAGGSLSPPNAPPQAPRRYVSWAELLRRVFAIDVLACACGGRLRFVATIEDPPVVHRILRHLGLPTDIPQPAPPRAPPTERALAFDFPD
jgi:Putative transposase